MAQTPELLLEHFLNPLHTEGLLIDNAQPDLWTYDETMRLINAAPICRWTWVGLSFDLPWNFGSLVPFLIIFMKSPHLASFSLRAAPENDTPENRKWSEMLIGAATMNKHRSIGVAKIDIFPSPAVFGSFLSRMPLRILTVNVPLGRRRSAAVKEALVQGASVTRLELASINSRHASRVLASLDRLTNLENLQLVLAWDRPRLLRALAKALYRCPLKTVVLVNMTAAYHIDLSRWLARTRFAEALFSLHLFNHLLEKPTNPGITDRKVEQISLTRCRLGPGCFQALQRFHALKKITLHHCNVPADDESFSQLLSLSHLETLQVENIPDQGVIPCLVKNSPRRLELSLGVLSLDVVSLIETGLKVATLLKGLSLAWDAQESDALAALGKAVSTSGKDIEELQLHINPSGLEVRYRDDCLAFLKILRGSRIKTLNLDCRRQDQ